jgi:hypothetical protein
VAPGLARRAYSRAAAGSPIASAKERAPVVVGVLEVFDTLSLTVGGHVAVAAVVVEAEPRRLGAAPHRSSARRGSKPRIPLAQASAITDAAW